MKKIKRFLRRYLLLYPIVYAAKILLRINLLTCRIEVEGVNNFIKKASRERCILMLWHNRLIILPEILRGYTPQFIYRAFISHSRDGELLAILTNSYAAGRTLRVRHNARWHALSRLITQLKQGGEIMVVTPDGPRGPRYQVKKGIAVAAKETQASIIPLSWSCERFWQLKSWDRLIIPIPFSKIKVSFGDPIDLYKQGGKDLEEEIAYLQQMQLQLDTKTCSAICENSNLWPK